MAGPELNGVFTNEIRMAQLSLDAAKLLRRSAEVLSTNTEPSLDKLHDLVASLAGLVSRLAAALDAQAAAQARCADDITINASTVADSAARTAERFRGEGEVTADTVTHSAIEKLRGSLPYGHYAIQWTIDAIVDPPGIRRNNARRECAALINARAKAGYR